MIMLLSLELRMKGFIAGIQYLRESRNKSTNMADMSQRISKKWVKLFTFGDFLLVFEFSMRSFGATTLLGSVYVKHFS